MEIKVFYEDNHLIAVYKPAGVLVQAENNTHNDDTLYWQVKQFIKQRDQKPGDAFLGVLHRLDRPVSGIVLFAKTSKGASRLSEQFRERTITKIYHAVVVGRVEPPSATLQNLIHKDDSSLKAIIGHSPSGEAGEEAVLHYETVQATEKFSLLKIQLETGKFHQIRAQLAAIGYPIVGDVKYGAPSPAGDGAICLAATELNFTTATDPKPVTISIPYPSIWKEYIGT